MYKYVYVCVCVCVCVCVFVYINLSRESIPAINHLVLIKKKKMSTAHLLITKPQAQGPIHELPHRKNASLFKRKNKNATLPRFSSTTPLLLFSPTLTFYFTSPVK